MGRIITYDDPIFLTNAQITFCRQVVASRRDSEAKAHNFTDRKMSPRSDLETNEIGARCECAVAIKTELPWLSAMHSEKLGADVDDIGVGKTGMQVRGHTMKGGDLIIRPRDEANLHKIWVCVWEKNISEHYLVGWIYGYEGKEDDWWADPGNRGRPCWCVPQGSTRPMSQLGYGVRL
jgi:hypothetical protein